MFALHHTLPPNTVTKGRREERRTGTYSMLRALEFIDHTHTHTHTHTLCTQVILWSCRLHPKAQGSWPLLPPPPPPPPNLDSGASAGLAFHSLLNPRLASRPFPHSQVSKLPHQCQVCLPYTKNPPHTLEFVTKGMSGASAVCNNATS